jgi:hypothetical protein
MGCSEGYTTRSSCSFSNPEASSTRQGRNVPLPTQPERHSTASMKQDHGTASSRQVVSSDTNIHYTTPQRHDLDLSSGQHHYVHSSIKGLFADHAHIRRPRPSASRCDAAGHMSYERQRTALMLPTQQNGLLTRSPQLGGEAHHSSANHQIHDTTGRRDTPSAQSSIPVPDLPLVKWYVEARLAKRSTSYSIATKSLKKS